MTLVGPGRKVGTWQLRLVPRCEGMALRPYGASWLSFFARPSHPCAYSRSSAERPCARRASSARWLPRRPRQETPSGASSECVERLIDTTTPRQRRLLPSAFLPCGGLSCALSRPMLGRRRARARLSGDAAASDAGQLPKYIRLPSHSPRSARAVVRNVAVRRGASRGPQRLSVARAGHQRTR